MKIMNYVRTDYANFSWDAGGKGACAHSSAWVIFERYKTIDGWEGFKVITFDIHTTTASGNHRTGCPFDDGQKYFDEIWRKVQGKSFSCQILENGLVHDFDTHTTKFMETPVDVWLNRQLQECI